MKIKNVSHVSAYMLSIVFDDGKMVMADFKDFITKSLQPMTNQFKDIERFKTVSIDNGHLSWEDGEMEISCHSIYKGKFTPKKKSLSMATMKNDAMSGNTKRSQKRTV